MLQPPDQGERPFTISQPTSMSELNKLINVLEIEAVDGLARRA